MDLLTGATVFKSAEKRRYMDWQFDIVAGAMFSQRSGSSCAADLLQNCDLPPPATVFSPAKDVVMALGNVPKYSTVRREAGGENTSLLRALQLSQTRAREAEKAAALLSARNRQMAALLLEESHVLFAHQWWVKLLDVEISMLRRRRVRSELEKEEIVLLSVDDNDNDDGGGEVVSTGRLCFALALCFGIAGMGFVLGRCVC